MTTVDLTTTDPMSRLRDAVAQLDLPVDLDVDGQTVVIRMPRDLNTHAEVRVLRLVEQYTGDFRRAVG